MRLSGMNVLAVTVVLLGAGAAGAEQGLPSTLRVLTAADEIPEMFSFDPSTPPGLERELIEVFPMRHVVVNQKPDDPVSEPDDLRMLRVGVLPGTTWEDVAIEAGVPDELRVRFPDAHALFAGLREGTIDAVAVPITSTRTPSR